MKKFITALFLVLFLAVNAGAKNEDAEIEQATLIEKTTSGYYPVPDCIVFFGTIFCMPK